MGVEDNLKLALEFNLAGNILSQLKGVQSGIDAIGSSLSALGASEAFIKMQEGLTAVTKTAADLQQAMASVKAITGLADAQLALVQKHSEEISETIPTATPTAWLEGYKTAYQVLHNTAAATKMVDNAFKVNAATGMDVNSVLQMMTVAHENLGESSTDVANILGATTRQFALSTTAGTQATLAFAKMAGVVKELGGTTSETMAILGEAEQLTPGRGLQSLAGFIERMPDLAPKLGFVNFKGGPLALLQTIQDKIKGMGDTQKRMYLQSLGISGQEYDALNKLLPVLDKVRAARDEIAKAGGSVLAQEQAAMAGTLNSQLALLSHSWESLKAALGGPLLAAFTSISERLKGVTDSVRVWVVANPALTRELLIGGAAIVTITAALGSLGAALMIGSSVIAAFGAAFALVVSPVGLVIAGIASVAAAGAWLYSNWGHINWSDLGKKIADGILNAIFFIPKEIVKIFSAIDWLSVGLSIVKGIAQGLKAGVALVGGAAHEVAHRVAGYFKGASPPPLGPLHDINRIPLTQTIAESLRPAPVVNAMRQVAASAALVGMVSLGGPMAAQLAPPARARPAGLLSEGMGRAHGASASAAPVIHIGATTINISGNASRADVSSALDENREKLLSALRRELDQRGRREF